MRVALLDHQLAVDFGPLRLDVYLHEHQSSLVNNTQHVAQTRTHDTHAGWRNAPREADSSLLSSWGVERTAVTKGGATQPKTFEHNQR